MQSIFISSTFQDMQYERDVIHRTVLPRLRDPNDLAMSYYNYAVLEL